MKILFTGGNGMVGTNFLDGLKPTSKEMNICDKISIQNYVNNVDLKSKEDLETLAYKSIEELERRYHDNCDKYKTTENIFILTSSDYIRNNFKEKLLFYSMNHPTKYVIQNICEQIIVILNRNNTIRYDIDVLDHYKSILYKSLQKAVNFDLNDHKPHVNNNTNAKDITQLYYETYQNIGFF
jgi:UDP-glucose 4-epimerase